MDSPNRTQNRITGWVVSTKPSGWKPSGARQVAVLEDPDQGPEARHDRQRVHHQRLGRQHDRAQQDEQHEVRRHDDEQRGPREVRGRPGPRRRPRRRRRRRPARPSRPVAASGRSGRAGRATSALPSSRFGPYGRVERERGQVAVGRRRRAPSRRSGRAGRSGRRRGAGTGRASAAGRRRRGCRRGSIRGSAASRRE